MDPKITLKEASLGRAHFFIYLLILLILVSCGKKNKVVTREVAGAPVVAPGPVIPDGNRIIENTMNQEMLSQIQMVKTKYPCTNNLPRLEFKYFVPVQNNPLSYIPQVQLQTGAPPAGNISKVYMGLYPNFNDLLIVMDIAQGASIVARAITISLCQQHPVIIPERPLSIVMATTLSITENPYCVIGNVKGDFLLDAPAHPPYPALPMPMKDVFINFPVCQNQGPAY